MLTSRVLEEVDKIARAEAQPGEEPNRSRVIRRFVGEGVERARKGADQ